jgi:hypothetical protein
MKPTPEKTAFSRLSINVNALPVKGFTPVFMIASPSRAQFVVISGC